MLLAPFNTARAAEIRVQSFKEVSPGVSLPVIQVFGDLSEGDAQRFTELTNDAKGAVILFDSLGGSLIEAIRIGERIFVRQFTTIAVGTCASACAIAWLAGSNRIVTAQGKIGFHAAYSARTGRVSSAGNAVLGAYLQRIGLTEPAIMYITNPPPQGVQWLTKEAARQLGIRIEVR